MLHLSIAAASTAAVAPAPAAEPLPDAELLALGQRFDAELERLRTAGTTDGTSAEDDFEAADDVLDAIMKAATAARATSLGGLAVKARIVTYADERYADFAGGPNLELSRSLAFDVIRLTGDDPERTAPAAAALCYQAPNDLAA